MNYKIVHQDALKQCGEDRTLILFVPSGSRSYGMEHEASDWDAHGIYIGNMQSYLGYRNGTTQYSNKNKELNFEYTVYDIRKFFALASESNPNVIEMLYYYGELFSSSTGIEIINNRHQFLSNRARYSFTGYAMSQLKRIKTHRSWLMHPPKKKPERSDYGLPNDTTLNHDTVISIEAAMAENATLIPPSIIEVWKAERMYQNAKREYEQYEGWKQNRNPYRASLEKQYGYDTHHAKHLARLLTAGRELLATGHLPVELRGERREFVMSIANGEVDFDSLLSKAQELHDEVMEMKSCLPDKPNHDYLDKLCAELIEAENGRMDVR